MTNPFLCTLVAGLVSAGFPLAAIAAEDKPHDERASLESLTAFAENSTFVWLDMADSDPEGKAMSLHDIAARFEGSILYEELGGFLVPLGPEETRRSVQQVQEELGPSKSMPKVQSIEPNALVHAFVSGCQTPTALPTNEVVPPGVERVNGPANGSYGSTRVWVIDSGIADDFDGNELNVNRTASVTCDKLDCVGIAVPDDAIGHGTHIAGTIGAKPNADGEGLVGVAPGVELIAVQVFATQPKDTLAVMYRAIQHVAKETSGAQSGDVVNISWGGPWSWSPSSDQRKIEVKLQEMANRGVKIAVAAGNNDVLHGSGYVQTVSPARAGAYRQQGGDGAIITVSAAHSQEDPGPGDWIDVFWTHSAFGNGEEDSSGTFYLGPPDFAEPGVDIVSLWPGNEGTGQMNTCTGTSFATAHMSGILVTGMPQADGAAAEDPSALQPDGQYDPAQLDRIGVR